MRRFTINSVFLDIKKSILFISIKISKNWYWFFFYFLGVICRFSINTWRKDLVHFCEKFTDVGRCAMTIAHSSLGLGWAKKSIPFLDIKKYIQFFDIKKSFCWYQEMDLFILKKRIFCIKEIAIDFLMSKNRFLISRNGFFISKFTRGSAVFHNIMRNKQVEFNPYVYTFYQNGPVLAMKLTNISF